jgi:putative phosphoesterase
VHAVAGNVDDPDVRMLLPRVHTVDAGGARIAMIHDAGPAAGRLERMRAADAILHAGDLVAVSVLRELEALGPPVHAVAGNVDDPDVRMLLPRVRTVDAGGARIAMIHDAGPAARRLERMRRTFPDADAVVFGHSHIPLHEERDGFQIFNPGSPTDRRRQPTHTLGVATIDHGRARFALVSLD